MVILQSIVVDCGNLPDPENGMVDISSTYRSSVATYSCDEGYFVVGVVSRLCQEDGMWSDQEPICTRKDIEDSKFFYSQYIVLFS